MVKLPQTSPDRVYEALGLQSWHQILELDDQIFEGTIGQAHKKYVDHTVGPVPVEGAERVTILQGSLKHRLVGENDWTEYQAGEVINISGNSTFEWQLTSDEIRYECIYLAKPIKTLNPEDLDEATRLQAEAIINNHPYAKLAPPEPLNLEQKQCILEAIKTLQTANPTPLEIRYAGSNNVLVKHENKSLTGSHYGRVYAELITALLQKNPNTQNLLELSSGSAGISVAILAKMLGLKLRLIIPDSRFKIRHAIPALLGAEVILSPEHLGVAGANQVLKTQIPKLKSDKRRFLNHSHKQESTTAMQAVAEEIIDSLSNPALPEDEKQLDYFFSAMGNGTSLRGIGEPLKNTFPELKTIGVRYKNNTGSKALTVPGADEVTVKFPHLENFPPDEIVWVELAEVEAYATKNNLGLSSAMVQVAVQKYVTEAQLENLNILTINYDDPTRY